MISVPRPPAPDPLEAFTEDEVRACVAYAKPRQRWALAGYGADLAILAVLALTGPGRAVVRGAVSAGAGAVARAAETAAGVMGVASAWDPVAVRAVVRAGRAMSLPPI